MRINIYYILIGVTSTAQIFGLFGDQKYTDSASRIWFIHEESRNVTNSNLHWTVVFTARYARRKRKTVNLGARRPLPTNLATTRAVYQGTEAGQSAHGTSCGLCKQGKTVKNLLVYTRKPREP